MARRRPAVIEIPMLPERACSPNGGGTVKDRIRCKRECRDTAIRATQAAVSQPGSSLPAWQGAGAVIMDIAVGWCCGRKAMDDDNLITACKPFRDGIAFVLWGREDKHVRTGTITQVRGGGVTVITLRAPA